ncbi:flavin reductase family protein [Anaerotignum lactatifermentans]|uniref:Flavin reductase family protein n=1 Tax=Anaerotignum lactatifermentans TaxID=160404 RepID=A0ABS2GBK8_9FIRM|nr:flavin reductase family protein [Anaerotignum lactatifermentans]MBM6830339.1 flavin reductase family protein [Anaerotignum lactatifermentans]MBM6878864.1 flavin reductase family protein [Anaerotignum lactatifermentans]MBM6951900.1 flavin reductase family protein [Anaerotignum lactatifermentans]
MGKQVWKPGTVIYPVPAVMVSCGTMEEKNIVTVAWTGTVNTNPPMTYISLRPERHSYDIIRKNGTFVINLVTKRLARACDFCGVKSGRDVDKYQELGLLAEPGPATGCPIIAESPVNIECRVKEILPLGSHHMFLAEVVSVSVSDEYMDESGKFHFNRSQPICYSHGGYFTLGDQVGSFGYSVRKKAADGPKKARWRNTRPEKKKKKGKGKS